MSEETTFIGLFYKRTNTIYFCPRVDRGLDWFKEFMIQKLLDQRNKEAQKSEHLSRFEPWTLDKFKEIRKPEENLVVLTGNIAGDNWAINPKSHNPITIRVEEVMAGLGNIDFEGFKGYEAIDWYCERLVEADPYITIERI